MLFASMLRSLAMDKISGWLGKTPETIEEYNVLLKQVKRSRNYREDILGHDAVTCCVPAYNHLH